MTLIGAASVAKADDSPLLKTLNMNDEAETAFEHLLPANPGLDSALVAMRASHVCRGVQLKEEDLNDAIAIVTGALSPTFRDNPDVSHGKLEREQIDSLTTNELAFKSLRQAPINCFDVELRFDHVKEDLLAHGRPLSLRLAKVMQQTPASSEITMSEPPVTNIYVQEPPRRTLLQMLLPWNW